MLVYRLCEKDEVDYILKYKDLSTIGNHFTKNKKTNSHEYEVNKRYMHFFKDIDSLLYMFMDVGRYVCVFDIPDDVLSKYHGIGYYWDYIYFEESKTVDEYAIPSDEVDFKYLHTIRELKKVVDYEDYLDDPSLNDSSIITYEKGIEKRLLLE